MNHLQKLRNGIEKQAGRIEKARREKHTVLAQSIYLGTVGIMIAAPIIAGAYLGRWLDSHLGGYSFSWTVSLIVSGVFVGAINAYFFIRNNE